MYIYMEFRKMVKMTLYARQQKRHRCIKWTFGLRGRGTFKTIQQIKSVIEKLDEPHEKYRKKRSRSAKYGSK